MGSGGPVFDRSYRQGLRVQVPASSANLGPGFDVLGMALSLYAYLEADSEPSVHSQAHDSAHRWASVDESHPALIAFRAAGGRGALRVQCSIPSGRGLGFSGAVRVGGVCLGLAEVAGIEPDELHTFIADRRQQILDLSRELEGHGDNVAASIYGGVTAVIPHADGRSQALRLPLSFDLLTTCTLAVWVPSFQTSTAKSRQTLSDSVARADVVFNMAHAMRLVAALAEFSNATDFSHDSALADFESGLRSSLVDRLHQDRRLQAAPLSNKALSTMLAAGAMTGWLSGSGPTVAALCRSDQVDHLEQSLGLDEELKASGRLLRLKIDTGGLQAAR